MAKKNDIVLIYFEDQPFSFARIEDILPDSKPDWYHVKLLLLQIPPLIATWILRDVYIEGDEFTMDGKRMRLEKIVVPEEPKSQELTEKKEKKSKPAHDTGNAKVISMSDLKKK